MKFMTIKFFAEVPTIGDVCATEEIPFLGLYKTTPVSTKTALEYSVKIMNCLRELKEDLKNIVKKEKKGSPKTQLADFVGSHLIDNFKKDGIEIVPCCSDELAEERCYMMDGKTEYVQHTRLQLLRYGLTEIMKRISNRMTWSSGINLFLVATPMSIKSLLPLDTCNVEITICHSGAATIKFDAIDKIVTTAYIPAGDEDSIYYTDKIHMYEGEMRVDTWNMFVRDVSEMMAHGKRYLAQAGVDFILAVI